MSGNRAWPDPTGVDRKYDRCVYAHGAYWWAREHPVHKHYGDSYHVHPGTFNQKPAERNLWASHVEGTCHFPRERPPLPAALYSAVFLNPTGMGWVKNPTGPVVTMRAPYDEMLALTKRLAEMYPDTTYTVVKVCAEVRTPPKPTLEVKEY